MSMADKFSTLVEMYENSIKRFGSNKLFGVKAGGEYKWSTYKDFSEQVDAVRGALAGAGVVKGDTVAVIANNRTEWAVCAYATYGRAASYCPMYESQLLKDWEYIVRDSSTKLLFVANKKIYDQVQVLVEEIDTLLRVIFYDGDDGHKDSLASFMAEGKKNPTPTEHPKADDLGGFIYTSGTTGNPKGVLLTHDNICFNVQLFLNANLVNEQDTSLAFLPWAHSFGQNCELHPMFASGASMGIVEDVSTIIQNLGEVRPTVLFAVPRIFNRIYDGLQKKMEAESPVKRKLFAAAMENSNTLRELESQGKTSFTVSLKDKFFDKVVFSKVRERFGGRMRYAISGGSALNPEVAKFIDNLHIMVLEGYGLTETSPISSCNLPGARKIGSVGRAFPGVTVTIKDVEGYPKGTGEICVKGRNIMRGYHGLEKETRDVVEADGTFHTGDLGHIDEDGFIWIKGRVKEQYKLENGKYVVPAPIEETIALSPYIIQVMSEGANKPSNVALLVVDKEALKKWAAENGVSDAKLLTDPKVRALYEGEIKRICKENEHAIKGYEIPKNFALIDEEWTVENGMLTPKMSLKRRKVMEKYGDLINSLF
jgi:long-chain acyl-CoA synthetase